MIERPSARLILLDPQDRLFLFKVHQPSVYDPADPFRDPFWIMIGGLVDPGESFAETAVREAREETGLVVENVHWIWSREREMQWREKRVRHREQFFLGRTSSNAASKERFEPVDLAARLKALLREGPPVEPIVLS
jgi:8-oxo-dGTP pyrophosphatase MutT (NUDIX family)